MEAPSHHILIVEDDLATRLKLAHYFKSQGYRVSQAADGAEMRRILQKDAATLLMIDINLPGEDGLKLTREQRELSNAGIILVTGRTDTIDRVVGLEIGADDYVTKPFELRELLARVKNIIARIEGRSKPRNGPLLRFAGWTLDLNKRTKLNREGAFVELTRAEFKLLALLASHPGEVMGRDRLLHAIANRDWDAADRTVDVVVRRLRQKLGDSAKEQRIILTSHGEGYCISPAVVDRGDDKG